MEKAAVETTKHRILNAAARVVNRVGFSKATIDEIVQEAGISKGGFLYHFPAKTDCFIALIDRVHDAIFQDAREKAETMPDAPGRMLKAYVTSTLEWLEPPRSQQMVGAIENPELKRRLQKHRLDHYQMVCDNRIPEIVVETVFQICAGLWATCQLSEDPPEKQKAFRDKMLGVMFRMIDDASLSVR